LGATFDETKRGKPVEEFRETTGADYCESFQDITPVVTED
jgi:hypothetical protein